MVMSPYARRHSMWARRGPLIVSAAMGVAGVVALALMGMGAGLCVAGFVVAATPVLSCLPRALGEHDALMTVCGRGLAFTGSIVGMSVMSAAFCHYGGDGVLQLRAMTCVVGAGLLGAAIAWATCGYSRGMARWLVAHPDDPLNARR